MTKIRLVDAQAKAVDGELVIRGTLENSNDEVEIYLTAEVLEMAKEKPAKKGAKE